MNLVEKELSYTVVGALFAVFNEIGYGHKETVYQRALAAALREKKLKFREQVHTELIAFGEVVGKYYLDFLVEEKIIVEIKALANFRAMDYRQAKSYLQATKLPPAILASFTPDGVRYRRVLNI